MTHPPPLCLRVTFFTLCLLGLKSLIFSQKSKTFELFAMNYRVILNLFTLFSLHYLLYLFCKFGLLVIYTFPHSFNCLLFLCPCIVPASPLKDLDIIPHSFSIHCQPGFVFYFTLPFSCPRHFMAFMYISNRKLCIERGEGVNFTFTDLRVVRRTNSTRLVFMWWYVSCPLLSC